MEKKLPATDLKKQRRQKKTFGNIEFFKWVGGGWFEDCEEKCSVNNGIIRGDDIIIDKSGHWDGVLLGQL